MKKTKLALSIILISLVTTLSCSLYAQNLTFEYAYVAVQGKSFSKKLKVEVDFGDTPEQLKAGEEYSELLTNKRSYAAILNFMVENDFEIVETLDYSLTYNGSGGTSGIAFIMRKNNQVIPTIDKIDSATN